LSASLPILSGLHEIAPDYDALICDVWGVLHDGHKARPEACAALKTFRAERGRVVLLSNAPRPVVDLEEQFKRFGVPADCYDAIVTSGVAAHDDLARRSAHGRLKMYHLGPERDRGVFNDLPIDCVTTAEADIVLCTGLFDDDHETPDDYRDQLAALARRKLVMLCANPDLVVQRGGRLIPCAGGLAKLYEELGGPVVYYGKPYKPIYDVTLAALPDAKWPLAVGDGLNTDIRGANVAGLDALFIADGIHGEEIAPFDGSHMGQLLARMGVHARAAMRTLVW
jgi:HAD superfamily hydrolase (TIGR01459 family)